MNGWPSRGSLLEHRLAMSTSERGVWNHIMFTFSLYKKKNQDCPFPNTDTYSPLGCFSHVEADGKAPRSRSVPRGIGKLVLGKKANNKHSKHPNQIEKATSSLDSIYENGKGVLRERDRHPWWVSIALINRHICRCYLKTRLGEWFRTSKRGWKISKKKNKKTYTEQGVWSR